MNHFSYHQPGNIQEASAIAESYQYQVKYLAGGTDLVVKLKGDAAGPRAVIDLKGIDELNGTIELHETDLTIGALALLSAIESNPIVIEYFPALVEAVSSIGSVQIRNRATIGGNICNASPAADSLPPLFIYEAKVLIISASGSRTLPINDFILGPGSTALREGEILAALQIPIPATVQGSSFDRLTRRRGVDLATINICCQVVEGTNTVRFAVGAAAPVPFIVEDPSGILLKANIDPEGATKLINEMMNAAAPIDDVRASKEYRQSMLTELAKRTLARALDQLKR